MIVVLLIKDNLPEYAYYSNSKELAEKKFVELAKLYDCKDIEDSLADGHCDFIGGSVCIGWPLKLEGKDVS